MAAHPAYQPYWAAGARNGASFTHPKKGEGHSIPRTVFGKIFQREGKYYLPFQLEVDHALMDGLHIARYFEQLQGELNNPS